MGQNFGSCPPLPVDISAGALVCEWNIHGNSIAIGGCFYDEHLWV